MSASCEDGVLEVVLPKLTAEKASQKIEVK
ncbi:MAG: hypothetical protein R3219_05200 [Hydrogenovibrio sp.]|nr:hypothetical protein [Hydrogenovibrio sp.]